MKLGPAGLCFFSAALFSLISCGMPKPLGTYGDVPPFTLVSETGKPFDSRALDGHTLAFAFMANGVSDPGFGHRVEADMAATLANYDG